MYSLPTWQYLHLVGDGDGLHRRRLPLGRQQRTLVLLHLQMQHTQDLSATSISQLRACAAASPVCEAGCSAMLERCKARPIAGRSYAEM